MRARLALARRPRRIAAPALLQLMRLASPSLPVGGFSYSDGFEAAFEAGLVGDEPAALRWLLDQLHLGLARSDLPAVAHATRAWAGPRCGPHRRAQRVGGDNARDQRMAPAGRADGPLDDTVAAPARAPR